MQPELTLHRVECEHVVVVHGAALELEWIARPHGEPGVVAALGLEAHRVAAHRERAPLRVEHHVLARLEVHELDGLTVRNRHATLLLIARRVRQTLREQRGLELGLRAPLRVLQLAGLAR